MATRTMKERNMSDIKNSQRVVKIVVTTLTYVFLVTVAISVLFPFYWMINSSLKSLGEYRLTVPTFFPKKIMWGNYAEAFNAANLGTLFLNTLYASLGL